MALNLKQADHKQLRLVEAQKLESLIGNTPLLHFPHLTAYLPRVELYAKAEWFNPGGSVKDRPALNIIRQAERRGARRDRARESAYRDVRRSVRGGAGAP